MSTTNILDLNNRVGELAESYPASKVMMSDGVTSVEDAVDEVVENVAGQYWGTYPNGMAQGYIRITIPLWNCSNSNITVEQAYVYDSEGNFTDIKSTVTVITSTKAYAIARITFNSAYSGKLLRINLILN